MISSFFSSFLFAFSNFSYSTKGVFVFGKGFHKFRSKLTLQFGLQNGVPTPKPTKLPLEGVFAAVGSRGLRGLAGWKWRPLSTIKMLIKCTSLKHKSGKENEIVRVPVLYLIMFFNITQRQQANTTVPVQIGGGYSSCSEESIDQSIRTFISLNYVLEIK